ncbi:LAMI_0G15918g1_1 [Lachancea mirantina]|uniref:LAMI_0G15918g1_1 n=1 Tax=Lachancea mirantina TaxID=1230905 RepID=A0A1G4KCJ8_9SACH|nr:LAMI_0G15918g1_1 [Lachancea mirantina]
MARVAAVKGYTNLISAVRNYSDTQKITKASVKYCALPQKSYIKVRGPDSVPFLNGLTTSKLLPLYVKKNLTTIGSDETSKLIDIKDYDYIKGNAGLFNEFGEDGPYISRFGTYTGFLNSKGKLLTDSIIYPTPVWPEDVYANKFPRFLLELDQSVIPRMSAILETHKLLRKVKIEVASPAEFNTWHLSIKLPLPAPKEMNPWIENLVVPSESLKTPDIALQFARHVLSMLFQGNEHKVCGMYLEKRLQNVLYEDPEAPQDFRVVTSPEVEDIASIFNFEMMPFQFDCSEISVSEARRTRYKHGLLDSLSDFKAESLLPLEMNFDYLPNAVSFDKGCYVGQELTARTYATGVLRKRCVAVRIDNFAKLTSSTRNTYFDIKSSQTSSRPVDSAPSPFQNAKAGARNRRQKPAGTLLCHEKDFGVALLRTEFFKSLFSRGENGDFYIEEPVSGDKITIIPQKPFWYDDWLDENQDTL